MKIEEQEKYVYTRLKQEREKCQMSQLELSLESGVSQNMITYIENGKRTPSITTILKLCDAMKISPSVLFFSAEDEKLTAKKLILDLVQRYM